MQQRREAVSDLVSQGVSVKAACDAVGLIRASFYRRPMGWRVSRSLLTDLVLAYNTELGISLSESARMTFYGRLG